jgi:uncharacterized protein YaaR (DUF327 family)
LKIQQSPNITQERIFPKREKGTESPSFQQIFQENQKDLSQTRLKSLLQKLENQSSRLGQSQSIQDLLAYKETIKSFLQEVVQNGLSLEDHSGFTPNGREKKLTMIKQVDEKLVELSDQVLSQQAPTIDLLTKMGEIKGLLINLYL